MTPVVGAIYRFIRESRGDQEYFILLISKRQLDKLDCAPVIAWTTLTTFDDGRVVLSETQMIDRTMRENPEWFERVT